MDSSTTTLLAGLFPIEGCLVRFFIISLFIEIPVFNASHVDSDQMPHSAASDLGLHCLVTLFGGFPTKMGQEQTFDILF